jgi:hypothetical protein
MHRRWILLLLALFAFLWTALRSWGYQVDDTFITLRFARSMVEGHGLVFNPGERVEGYTSLGFVLAAALFLRLGIDPVSGLVALSAAAALATLWLAARLERTIVGLQTPRRSSLSFPFLLASSPFAFWSLRAMETLPFGALFLGAVSLSLRESRRGRASGSAALFALLALTRPEGPLLFGVWSLALLAAERRTRGDWSTLRRHAANALLVVAVVGAQLAWRWHSYGDLLPNTFYAKVTGGPGQLETGLRYLRDWCLELPLFAASLAFPLLLLARPLRSRLPEPSLALALYATLVAYVLYVVAVGADFMPYFRFFVAVLPLCAVLAAAALRSFPRRSSSIAIAALVVQLAASLWSEQPYRAFVAQRTTLVGARVGAWLAERLEPSDWIAVNTAGSLPYASRLPTIDMLGLTDAQIAKRPVYIVSEGWAGHRRGWGEYVLRRGPRVVLWYNSAGLAEPHYLGDHELAEDPLFRFFYAMRVATLPPAEGSEPNAVLRRFLGFPFGFDASGASAIPDLGLRVSFHERPFDWTGFSEGPLRVVYFERDARDGELFEAGLRLRGNPRAVVELAAARWVAEAPREGDPAAQAEVEALCADALRAIEAGDRERAKAILEHASRRNVAARSPRVPQYVANLAVLTGELFLAVSAQKEALRLDPSSALYSENLIGLLSEPWEGFRERAAGERD